MARIAGREITLAPFVAAAPAARRAAVPTFRSSPRSAMPRASRLDEGLPPTLEWYWDHESVAPAA